MGFLTKIKSLFQTQEPKIHSRDEVIKEHQKNLDKQKIEEVKTVHYEPITYNYKTAKEKAAEPIPPDERNWVIRFENRECPYCHHIFEQIKGNRKCPECKNKVIVRSHFQTKGKCILTEEEVELFDKRKNYYYDVRWCVRECGSLLEITENQFMKEWDKKGKTYSPFDIMMYFINKKRIEYAKKDLWGLYRNTFVLQGHNFDRRGKEEDAYRTYLYVTFIDANGPMNNDPKRFSPVDSVNEQAPGIIAKIQNYAEKYGKTLEDLKKDFYYVTKEDKTNNLYPLSPVVAWRRVEEAYNHYNQNSY